MSRLDTEAQLRRKLTRAETRIKLLVSALEEIEDREGAEAMVRIGRSWVAEMET